jgi:hypothetical protein
MEENANIYTTAVPLVLFPDLQDIVQVASFPHSHGDPSDSSQVVQLLGQTLTPRFRYSHKCSALSHPWWG